MSNRFDSTKVQIKPTEDPNLLQLRVNEALRRVSKVLAKLEGRGSSSTLQGALKIKSDSYSMLDFEGQLLGKGSIGATTGTSRTLFLARGARREADGQWVANDTGAVILEMKDNGTMVLYANTNLVVGAAFQPTVSITLPSSLTAHASTHYSSGSDPIRGPLTLTSGGLTTGTGCNIDMSSANTNKPTITLTNTNGDSTCANLIFVKNGGTPANFDTLGRVLFYGYDTAQSPNLTLYGQIIGYSSDVADTSEDGTLSFHVIGAGTLAEQMYIQNNLVYVVGTMSAGTVVDRTPAPKDVKEAYDIVASYNAKDREVDKSKLHSSAKLEEGRNLSMVVSALSAVVKDLVARVEALEKKG